MKVLGKALEKDLGGTLKLQCEEREDMWHAYNLIARGDRVRTATVRKVVKESMTGSTTSQRVRLNLTIIVEKADFDTEQCVLRLSGKNVAENPHVRVGAYHTLDLEMNQTFSIEKDWWDTIHLERIEDASDPVKQAELAAVVMTAGLAHVCLVTSHMTVTRARLETNIPRKRAGSSEHAKAIQRFFDSVYRAVLEKIDFDKVKCILLGSPGFVKDDFFEYLNKQALLREDRILIENKAKFVLCHAASGHKRAVEELLSDPSIAARLADTKAAAEVQALKAFYVMLKVDPDRAFYGIGHIEHACENGAVDSLLVSDALFRAQSIETRRRYVKLVENVRDGGGKVFVFSSLHVSGEQLGQFGGVAAVLRFPMPDIEDDVDESDEGEQDQERGERQENGVNAQMSTMTVGGD
jgi:protein pelota